jgi:molecular chaperone HscA
MIVQYWIKKAGIDYNELKSNKILSQSLRLKAEEAKKWLSDHEIALMLS